MLVLVFLPIVFGVTNSFSTAGIDCKEKTYFNGKKILCSNGETRFEPKPNIRFKWGVDKYVDSTAPTIIEKNEQRYKN